MAQYKLTYFDARAKAETIRLIFAVAGVQYEDVRVPQEQWPAMKPSTPMGQLPILETEGTALCQSLAIARYLARRFGLAGKTELEQTKVDIIVDCVEDAIKPIPPFLYVEKDETRKAELKKTYIEEQLPILLNNLEKLLKANTNGDGFFVGDGLTWADLHILTFLERLEPQLGLKDPLDKYPKLKALEDRVNKLPKIAEWIAKRPKTFF